MVDKYQTTRLHELIVDGDLKGVEKLILKRTNSLGERNEEHRTALHLSVIHNQLHILEWLLAARANRVLKTSLDINAVDIQGNSALHLALSSLNFNAALMLLKDDASPFLPNHDQDTPLFVLFKSLHAVDTEQLPEINEIIDLITEKGISISHVNKNKQTILHVFLDSAFRFGALEYLLPIIISKDPKLLEITNKEGKSSFEVIIRGGYYSLLPLLLSASPSPLLCQKVTRDIKDPKWKQVLQEYIDDQEASDFVVLSENVLASPILDESGVTEGMDNEKSSSVTPKQDDTPFYDSPIKRRRPGLITRCRILDAPFPSDHVEVKVLALVLDSTFVTKLNIHMKVKQAIAKLREHETLARMQENDLALYLPAKGSAPSSIHVNSAANSPSLQRNCNDSTAVWLDPELCLWHYALSNGDLISLKRQDAEVDQYLWIKIMIQTPVNETIHKVSQMQPNMGLLTEKQQTVRIRRGMKVSSLAEYLHSIFIRVANQYMALYMYDEHHEGHWMDKEDESIEYYNVNHMDIIELKEKQVYKIAFMDGSESSLLSCSSSTKVSEFVKMIICSISSIVDDPTAVGICCVKKDNQLLSVDSRLWLPPDSLFGDHNLHEADELHCFSHFGDSNSHTIARLLIRSDPNSSCAFIPRRDLSAFGGDIPLLGGEQVLGYCSDVRYMGVGQHQQDGTLFVTNAHVIFARQAKGYLDYSIRITLGTIARIDRPSNTTGPFLDVYCKDMRTIRFVFLNVENGAIHRKEMHDMITNVAFPKFYQVFAFHHRLENTTCSKRSSIFDIEDEFQRMNVSPKLWRISSINKDYSYCSTYPQRFIVPASVDDNALAQVFPFRSKGRISILTYYHPNTATITRCSQPKVGITNARSEADEDLTDAIRLANQTNSNTLYLFDARPKANAIANQAIGMGYESSGRYQSCKLEFLNIDNIHVMRDSYYKVQRICETTYKDDKNFYTGLDTTHWLSYIKLLLVSSVKIAHIVDRGCSVLLHCSDGWDRTAQLAALAQIFLSPNYRTIKGFQYLIEKDWLSVGHKFGIRCGHADPSFGSEQRSPIFLQFIDCVWQCINQFPCLFEFNEKFLLTIMDHVYSCHYGTFMMNNERERVQANISEITACLWDDIANQRDQYINPFYLPGLGVVFPSTYYEDLRLWNGYYLRYCRTPNPYQRVTAELRGMQMKAVNESLQSQIEDLKEQLRTLEMHKVNEFKKTEIDDRKNTGNSSVDTSVHLLQEKTIN